MLSSEANDRSEGPVASIANWRSAVLLIHGDDDRNVPFQQPLIWSKNCAPKTSRSRS